jgi:hypothetical protein
MVCQTRDVLKQETAAITDENEISGTEKELVWGYELRKLNNKWFVGFSTTSTFAKHKWEHIRLSHEGILGQLFAIQFLKGLEVLLSDLNHLDEVLC